jgi:hypothetical protein
VDTITIVVRGPKRFRQKLMNKLYEMLMEEDFLMESTKPGCSYSLTSSIEPSDEVM